MKIITFWLPVFIALFSSAVAEHSHKAGAVYDLLITGGTVIDGTGRAAYQADVLVSDGRIVFVGSELSENIEVARVIDASGRVVTPGFIDTHAHGNPLTTPEFRNFTAMGVTTISLGQDGSSPGAGDTEAWMKQVQDAGPAVNIAHFVGHGSLRRHTGFNERTDLSEAELQKLADLVEEAMNAGSFGMTTGLEYLPGTFADMNELVSLARPVGRYGGLIMSHMRSEDEAYIEASVRELIEQGRRSGTRVHISHIKIVYSNNPDRAGEILQLMHQAREEGIAITADIYPYIASYTGIGIVFPEWAKAPHNYQEVRIKRRAELAEYLRHRINLRNGPEATLFGTAPFAGKTLAQIANEKEKPFEDVLIDYIGPQGAAAAYFVMNQEVMERFLADAQVMICSDGSPAMRHPRGYGTFARIIREFVMEKKLLSLEEAVHKMTGLPAVTLGLNYTSSFINGAGEPWNLPRGLIMPEFAADILIFDPLTVQDRATFEDPHLYAEGFDYVLVNGEPVREKGEFTANRPGRVLRK